MEIKELPNLSKGNFFYPQYVICSLRAGERRENYMKKIILIVSLLFLLSGCANDIDYDCTGSNMKYDEFRGSSSSIANQVQIEGIKKSLEQFDFSKYKGKTVDIEITAGNNQVEIQISTLLNIIFIKEGILTPKKEYDEKGNLKPYKYDYLLKLNAICGGYHFYSGMVFHKYQSTIRIVMLESKFENENESRYFDSGYQSVSVFKPVLTQEYRISLYVFLFLLCTFALYRFGIFDRVGKTRALKR